MRRLHSKYGAGKPRGRYFSIYVFFIVMVLIIAGCTGYNNASNVQLGNFELVVSKNGKHAFVKSYTWSGDPADNQIYVPDTDGKKATVEQLGGMTGIGVPNPFTIETQGCGIRYVDKRADSYLVPVSFEDMVFEIHIGPNIEGIVSGIYSETYVPVEQPDGSVIFYHPLVNFVCDPLNEKICSQNGMLYWKENGELIDDFPYEYIALYGNPEDESDSGADSSETGNDGKNSSSDTTEDPGMNSEMESYEAMDPTAVMVISLENRSFTVDMESNASAKAFWEKVKTDAPKIEFSDNGDFEKVGDLPWEIEANDEKMTAEPGDLILYNGNKICIFYGENTWDYTKLGTIYATEEEMKEFFGGKEDLTAQIYLEWTE